MQSLLEIKAKEGLPQSNVQLLPKQSEQPSDLILCQSSVALKGVSKCS